MFNILAEQKTLPDQPVGLLEFLDGIESRDRQQILAFDQLLARLRDVRVLEYRRRGDRDGLAEEGPVEDAHGAVHRWSKHLPGAAVGGLGLVACWVHGMGVFSGNRLYRICFGRGLCRRRWIYIYFLSHVIRDRYFRLYLSYRS